MGKTGKTIGSIAGALIGTAIAPGVGTAIGSSVGGMAGDAIEGSSSSSGSSSGGGMDAGAQTGLATGALQALMANKYGNKAEAAMPDMIDPNQSSYLAELNQKRKSIETGADFSEAIKEADQSQASTNDSILKATGGDSGGAIQGLLQSQSIAGMSKNRALGQGQQHQFAYDSAYGNMLNQISARKLQLELYNTDRALAQQASLQQGANQNFMSGLGRMLSGNQGQPGNMVSDPAKVTSAGDTFSGGGADTAAEAETMSPEMGSALAGIA